MSRIITQEDLFDIEKDSPAGQYLRSEFWFPAATSDSLVKNRTRVATVLGTKITLYRGASGVAHAVGSHCPHRKTSLASGYVEGETLRCLYHGWRFDSTGECLEQPLSFNCRIDGAKIDSYPTKEYLGLVFVYLGTKNPPPAIPSFPDFEARGNCLAMHVSDWPCNFFTMIEGATDWGHTVFTHRRSGLSDGLPPMFTFQSEECQFGIRTFNTSIEDAALTNDTQFYMPCANFFDVPSDDKEFSLNCLIWRVPLDNGHVRNFIVVHSVAANQEYMVDKLGLDPSMKPSTSEVGDAILSGHLSLNDVIDRADLIQIEDYVAQVGQLGPSVAMDCLLTPADSGIRVMRSLWIREIQRFFDGAPLKEWKHLTSTWHNIEAMQ